MACCRQVFTTCGSAAKRAFLRDTFPWLSDAHIGDLRSTSLGFMIYPKTLWRERAAWEGHLSLAVPCCRQVFTTCGSAAKRAFLRDTFPWLSDAHIGDLRSTSLGFMIYPKTLWRERAAWEGHLSLAVPCCRQVFTTCGSAAKRAFLRDTFPWLSDAHIGDSRSTAFEATVLQGVRSVVHITGTKAAMIMPDNPAYDCTM